MRALLESARISNLPTVWTNVLVGLCLANRGDIAADTARTLAAFCAASLFYTGGMWLNDAVDAQWDRAHGKDRPIPARRISRTAVYAAAVLALTAGVVTTVQIRPGARELWLVSLLLLTTIVLYDLLHKCSAWCVLLMGACRALLYPLAASIAREGYPFSNEYVYRPFGAFGLTWGPSAAILAYVALLTLAARRENIAGARVGGVWAWLMPLPFLAAAALADRTASVGITGLLLASAALFVGWTLVCARPARAGRVPQAVSGWLAGICLADATLLVSLNRLDLAAIAVGCWLLTPLFQRTIPGT